MNEKANVEVLDEVYEGAYIVDKDRKISRWNKGAEKLTGFLAEEVINKPCYANILNHIDENGVALCFNGCPLAATIDDGKVREANVFLQHKDGYRVPVCVKAIPITNDDHEIIGALELFTENKDNSQIRNALERYQKESSEDQLTGVPNRRYLNAILESKHREFHVLGLSFAVAFLDIDNFKRINDTYGHEVGDSVLKLMVKTIQSGLRMNDVIGRWGGEEFIIVFANVDESGAKIASEKVRSLVENSVLRMPNFDIQFTISIGTTLFTHNDSPEKVVKRADELMYLSKKNGKNRVTVG